MIIVKDESDIPAAIEKIISIDNDEKLYQSVLREPALLKQDIFDGWYKNLEDFLCYIIDNPVDHYTGRSREPLINGYYQNFKINVMPRQGFISRLLRR